MADPVKKPLTWSKAYPAYAEKHDMYRVFQELLKELIVTKPLDPLAYIRDELPNVANQLHAPRMFILGPNVTTQGIGRHIAQQTGSHFLTLSHVVEAAPKAIRGVLAAYVEGEQEELFDENIRKLLVATIMQRLRCADCRKNGYVLYGFPQNKYQALCAQQSGLLPRQVYILMPESSSVLPSKSTKLSSNVQISTSTTIGPSTGAHTSNISPTEKSQFSASGPSPADTLSGKSIGAAPTSVSGASAPASSTQGALKQTSTNGQTSSRNSNRTSGLQVIEGMDGTITIVSSQVILKEPDNPNLKEIAECYDYEICKVIQQEKWSTTKKTDILAELLASLVTVKPCGAPWIPKILLVGPPSSGKSTIAEHISEKFGLVNVDFIEYVRGAAHLTDEVGKSCKKYLRDLYPMTDGVTRALLQKRLLQEDCERKGWVLHGFPDTIRQLTILDTLDISPNRVFYLACPEDVCWTRSQQKRQQVLERKLQGAEDKVLQWIDEMNFEEFPYGKVIFRMRMDGFQDNFDSIATYFGKNLIYVDATKNPSTIFEFINASVLRPPVVRYQEESSAIAMK